MWRDALFKVRELQVSRARDAASASGSADLSLPFAPERASTNSTVTRLSDTLRGFSTPVSTRVGTRPLSVGRFSSAIKTIFGCFMQQKLVCGCLGGMSERGGGCVLGVVLEELRTLPVVPPLVALSSLVCRPIETWSEDDAEEVEVEVEEEQEEDDHDDEVEEESRVWHDVAGNFVGMNIELRCAHFFPDK